MVSAKKKSGSVVSFKGLFELVTKAKDAEGKDVSGKWLKTAEKYGWLSNGHWATKLSDEDKEMLKDLMSGKSVQGKAENPAKFLPWEVGTLVLNVEESGKVTTLSGRNNRSAVVSSKILRTMQRRHKGAMLYFSHEEDGPVIVSGQNTLAIIPQMRGSSEGTDAEEVKEDNVENVKEEGKEEGKEE